MKSFQRNSVIIPNCYWNGNLFYHKNQEMVLVIHSLGTFYFMIPHFVTIFEKHLQNNHDFILVEIKVHTTTLIKVLHYQEIFSQQNLGSSKLSYVSPENDKIEKMDDENGGEKVEFGGGKRASRIFCWMKMNRFHTNFKMEGSNK